MSKRTKIETEVISFRVPKDTFERVNKQAKKVKKVRAKYVADIFLAVFDQSVTPSKQTA